MDFALLDMCGLMEQPPGHLTRCIFIVWAKPPDSNRVSFASASWFFLLFSKLN